MVLPKQFVGIFYHYTFLKITIHAQAVYHFSKRNVRTFM